MGMYEVKTALLTKISEADTSLQPQTTHVLGNWKINIWKLTLDTFPVVTVRITTGDQKYAWGFKTPTKTNAEYYFYHFTAFVYHESITEVRVLADKIIDYLLQNNTDATSGILDITEITSREKRIERGTRRRRKVEITGVIIAEETL